LGGYSRRELLFTLGGAALGAVAGGVFRSRAAAAGEGGFIRPPGALDEEDFLAACLRCDQCVQACPPQYGTLSLTTLAAGRAAYTPQVVPRQMPCFLCASEGELKCIAACPTDALSEVPDTRQIRMGVAIVDTERCWPYIGMGCPRPCYTECPFPGEAIRYLRPRRRPYVVDEHCIGCGICEYLCPTEPSSIVIRPRGQAR
jgi:ferredoxin-type protein NapG